MSNEIEGASVSPQEKAAAVARFARMLDQEQADKAAARERAMPAMSVIVEAIRNNPTTGQSGQLIRFLAGLYNGPNFPFDMTGLRSLDHHLADACIAVLDYDRYSHAEIHYWGQVKARELNQWFLDAGLYYEVQQRRIGREFYREKFPGGHPDEGIAD